MGDKINKVINTNDQLLFVAPYFLNKFQSVLHKITNSWDGLFILEFMHISFILLYKVSRLT